MEIVNTVKDGLHMDNNVYDQPEHTMRYNLNGIITNVGGNNYKWSNIKGNLLSFSLGLFDKYMSHCLIRDRLFIFTFDEINQVVKLQEVILVNNVGTLSLKWSVTNTVFNFSWEHPIRRMFGFYENEQTQRIYWVDFNNQARCVNIENLPINNKFIEFSPVVNHVYGWMTSADILPGGSVKAGSQFFAWRYYTNDGYYTDWSYLSNPVITTDKSPASNVDGYQNMQGMQPDGNTGKKIVITIDGIDNDYTSIQVCVFYSNDYNISIPGVIFYDGNITTGTMQFTYKGNENLGTVIIDELITSTIGLENFKDFDIAKKKNVIACITERAELDLDSYIEADLSVEDHHVPLDISNYPAFLSAFSDPKSLVFVTTAAQDVLTNTLRRGCWYEAITDLVWYDDTPHGPANIWDIPAGNIFKVPADAITVDWDSGTFKMITASRKYIKEGGTMAGDINTTSVFEKEYLNGDYPDFKSSKISRKFRSYPQGEQIRLGILFFDLAGRPFYVRHLRNTNGTYGPGDINIPKRSPTNKMLTVAGDTGAEIYTSAIANLKHIVVNDLDLTDIIDKISGFMIVRAPIVRQYEAMGIVVPTYKFVNDIYSYPAMYSYVVPPDTYYGCYDFYCPEDMFNFKGFSIQVGDKIENIQYCKPYYPDEDTDVGGFHFIGLGRRESNTNDFYNKFYIEEARAFAVNENGDLNISHDVLSVTRYELGQEDIPINPIDQTKLYKDHCVGYIGAGPSVREGKNITHSVLMLDTGDESTAAYGKKGITDAPNTDPYALVCALKRPNPDPYGGYSESSIANTVYMSTGHFQEINANVLEDVKIMVGGVPHYIFGGIEVYGGDTFVQLFDFKRILPNNNIAAQFGHSVIVPLETRMNLSMREGNHIAKTRSYDATYNLTGLNIKTEATVLEEFNYNDGYSSDNINDLYVPLPFNNKLINDRDARIRYSTEKNYGEKRDSFRVFLANDYIDLDTNKGAISNIRYKSNRLIYWQPNEVGYIPINERALTETSMGAPVQLGVGGIFERYDQLVDKIGNSHQFGLIESPMGYHWYDSRRKIYISINHGMQLAEDSILKGVDSFFQQNLPDDLDLIDNPFGATPQGVYGGYDPMTKMIFSSFKHVVSGTVITDTIGIHTLLNKFVGFYDLKPMAYFTKKDHLFEISPDKKDIYIHNFGNCNTFFGNLYEARVSIVVKEGSNEAKIFDTFESIGNANFFSSIYYENSEQNYEEAVVDYSLGNANVLIRNLKYLKKRWFGNFPRVNRERFNDGYLLITFKINSPYLVELLEFKTDVRKMM